MDYRRSLKITAAVTALIAALLLVLASVIFVDRFTAPPDQARQQPRADSLLLHVRERGFLRCGIEGGLSGFSVIQGAPEFTESDYIFYKDAIGFDADFCRVVAVAVFGTAEDHLFFTRADADKRFQMVSTGLVDLLIRNTTWTASRDMLLGVDFGPIIYHDGQKFLAPVDSGIRSLADLDGQTICVLPNTTTLGNMQAALDELDLTYQLVTQRRPDEDFRDTEDVIEAYVRQKCRVMAGDESQLLARHTELMNPNEHTLFPNAAISYEPLAPVVRENDSRWRDVVSYAILATIYGEQLGINSTNVGQYDDSSRLIEKQFLGIQDSNIEQYIGPALGLDQRFARNIIAQVGNYGEIFERNLGQIITVRGPNQIWALDNAGKLYAPPWQSAINPVFDKK